MTERTKRLCAHCAAVQCSFRLVRILSCVSLLVCAGHVHGYSFTLSPTEFRSWPDYCRAKYVRTIVGEASQYAGTVSPESVNNARSMLGDTWANIHHGCAGMVWILRADKIRGRDPVLYKFALENAYREAAFSIERTPPTSPIYWKLRTIQVRVDYSRGHKDKSLAELRKMIRKYPKFTDPYAVLASFLFQEKKFDDARQVLENGIKHVERPTAEMHYFLGLVMVKQRDYDLARKHAQEAYKMGYPLPGLRNQLKAAGHW